MKFKKIGTLTTESTRPVECALYVSESGESLYVKYGKAAHVYIGSGPDRELLIQQFVDNGRTCVVFKPVRGAPKEYRPRKAR